MLPNELCINSSLEKTQGIYMILCVPANKAYIGQSKNIKRRWYCHRQNLLNKKHENSYLQNLYNKYGKDSFFFYVLENSQDNLSEREAYYISLLDKECRVNLQGVLEVIPCSPETKRKISLANKGRKHSENTKKLISELKKGKKHTEESKRNMSKAQMGKIVSEETRKKMSETRKRIGQKPPGKTKRT